jgi:hypothetical protein
MVEDDVLRVVCCIELHVARVEKIVQFIVKLWNDSSHSEQFSYLKSSYLKSTTDNLRVTI